jgi:hypothetical protein
MVGKVVSLEEALRSIKGALQVNVGYCYWFKESGEQQEKSQEDLSSLGYIILTHAPGKMKQKLGTAWYPKTSVDWIIKENPHITIAMFTETGGDMKNYYSVLPQYQDIEYESDVWGDDWNDSPASCNAGPPEGELVEISPGDLVIVIKQGVRVENKNV